MLTNLQIFFWQPHANFTFQSQSLFFPKSFAPFHFWTFFLSIFEKTKYFLVYFSFNIKEREIFQNMKIPKICHTMYAVKTSAITQKTTHFSCPYKAAFSQGTPSWGTFAEHSSGGAAHTGEPTWHSVWTG